MDFLLLCFVENKLVHPVNFNELAKVSVVKFSITRANMKYTCINNSGVTVFEKHYFYCLKNIGVVSMQF